MTEAEWVMEMYKVQASVVKDLGNFALQALITINAGAIITLLTFIPKIIGAEKMNVDFLKIKKAIFFFLAGLLMAFLSVLVTYVLSQMQMSDHEFSNFWLFLFSMLAPAILSFVFFGCGAVVAVSSVKQKVLL